jgi:uncharacterized alkaline shock family protein YloU
MTDVSAGAPTDTADAATGTPGGSLEPTGSAYAMPSTTGPSTTGLTTPEPSTAEASGDAPWDRIGEVRDQASAAVYGAADAVHEVAEKAYDATREAAGSLVSRVRNNATVPADRGRTTIADEVVEKIAGIAAREVPGVYDLGGDAVRVLSAVREKLRLGEESAAQGVSVKLEGRQAEVTVVIVIEYGFQVFSVTEKVREKVISSVENLLGLEVTSVDVTVDDVHIGEQRPVGNDAERAASYSPETRAIVVGAPTGG